MTQGLRGRAKTHDQNSYNFIADEHKETNSPPLTPQDMVIDSTSNTTPTIATIHIQPDRKWETGQLSSTARWYIPPMAREVLNRVIYGVSKPLPSSPQYTLSLSLKISPALLPSYCRHKVQHADYPGIIPDASREVRGTYVTGLTEGDIWRLDRFEGSEYDRQDVVVTLLSEEADGRAVETEGKAEERRTQTYVYTAGEERLEKKEWDYEVFRREKLHRWADASDEYRGKSTSTKPSTTRRKVGMTLLVDEEFFPKAAKSRKRRSSGVLSEGVAWHDFTWIRD
ncbi:hypothetical protein JHW43_004498 [Diplocarpon mali]|nr:hypothetical protein JHW43_004498 [Diplocarpon mali]